MVVPRQDQLAAAKMAETENIILSARTGSGKTLVACLAIDHFLELDEEKHVLFVVPTRALVGQQARYIKEHCRVSVGTPATLCGNEMESWKRANWDAALGRSRVLVQTC
mmetsp:Transcript_34133/g.55711  ORF Transcript_34133/g.55711 Transcript_34133/m.55711 type:complete len:109 (-) Transcript_34133:26-352(-)